MRSVPRLNHPIGELGFGPPHLPEQGLMAPQFWESAHALRDPAVEQDPQRLVGQHLAALVGVFHWLHSWVGDSWIELNMARPSSDRRN